MPLLDMTSAATGLIDCRKVSRVKSHFMLHIFMFLLSPYEMHINILVDRVLVGP